MSNCKLATKLGDMADEAALALTKNGISKSLADRALEIAAQQGGFTIFSLVDALKSQLAKLDLLILDELGYVPASKRGAELLFDIISTAYERTSLIVTTNLPFENWTEVLGSERLTGATLDRLGR